MTWSEHVALIASNVSKHCGVICCVKYYLPNHILKTLAESLIIHILITAATSGLIALLLFPTDFKA